MAENIFLEEIYDGDVCKAVENFEQEINITNKKEKEAKTVEKSRFVELSEDDKIYIIKQINKPKPYITLCNTRLWLVYLLNIYMCMYVCI